MRKISGRFGAVAAITALLGMMLAVAIAAPAQTPWALSIVHTFAWMDGASPEASLIADAAGNLYGTTPYGGTYNSGVAFRVDQAGNETVLYSFTGGSDGAHPFGDLVLDTNGSLYGTTNSGGFAGAVCQAGCGVVFRLDAAGNETVLFSFSGGADGANPAGGLIRDGAGNLYGMTGQGGSFEGLCSSGCGVVFKLDPAGIETVLHSFSGADGSVPTGGLIRDAAGNLYGTTLVGGGASGEGVVFKLEATGQETVLHLFTGGTGGGHPVSGVLRDAAGYLYGATADGGNAGGSCPFGFGCGVIFRLDPVGNEIVLYTFTGGTDGATPNGTLIRDAAGNLYGTTTGGGRFLCGGLGCGVVFKLSPTGRESEVHDFTGGADGGVPFAGLFPYKGALYGTTTVGGNATGNCSPYGCGVLFSIKP